MSLQQKLDRNTLLWAFEVVPPVACTPADTLATLTAEMVRTLKPELSNLDALLLPELDPDECDSDGEKLTSSPHLEPREFAEYLRSRGSVPEIVLYRRTVQAPLVAHGEWLNETAERGYRYLIPVGGDSHHQHYRGPGPITFARGVQELNAAGTTNYTLGAVCIPTRGRVPRNGNFRPDPLREPRSMRRKETEGGIAFHTTQILYEIDHLRETYDRYYRLCEEAGKQPKPVLLGVAPMASRNSHEFLQRLGVHIPTAVTERILADDAGISKRSVQYLREMVLGFFDYAAGRYPEAKFGIYVECVNPQRLSLSVDLLGTLREAVGTMGSVR